MKQVLAIIAALFTIAYVVFQILFALLKPLIHALSGRLN